MDTNVMKMLHLEEVIGVSVISYQSQHTPQAGRLLVMIELFRIYAATGN